MEPAIILDASGSTYVAPHLGKLIAFALAAHHHAIALKLGAALGGLL